MLPVTPHNPTELLRLFYSESLLPKKGEGLNRTHSDYYDSCSACVRGYKMTPVTQLIITPEPQAG